MEPFIVIGLLYVGISYFLTPDNADGLLAGYNTMSDERKKLYDIASMVKALNLTMRYTGIFIGVFGTLTIILEWFIVAQSILLIGAIVPLMSANVYTRLKYSKDPMRWYDWILPLAISIGSIVLTYLTITN
ncbi:DUF3784 domain-containing protein [Myroides pelagicus]|uniref:DUF3784 domain-containing protein n=1 Tax=Myroides pelagicus TaxID=270914 RepID=A0A7K1GL66_9FLAO|nr:DUF3784 domain-containing protein [Myroides pelagicus]MEC4114726.1 DUF3784 domain-containing protein [Myroides pelagicus]MTH29279.1 DUF3784 domain-containing protein [Myroides pelagicus]